jgi:hypothetical protein
VLFFHQLLLHQLKREREGGSRGRRKRRRKRSEM